jgi:hypothetical protein
LNSNLSSSDNAKIGKKKYFIRIRDASCSQNICLRLIV